MNHVYPSRGKLSARLVLDVNDLGVSAATSALDQIIEAFSNLAEADPLRWIQMRKGVLLFHKDPESKYSGAIHVYDRVKREFYFLDFERGGDVISPEDFDELSREYKLLQYADNPALLTPLLDQVTGN